MNIPNVRIIAALFLMAPAMLLSTNVEAQVPSGGGGDSDTYDCRDSTTTDHQGNTIGNKSCKCFGGRGSHGCKKMLGECADLRDGSPPGSDDLVCDDEACRCSKKIESERDQLMKSLFLPATVAAPSVKPAPSRAATPRPKPRLGQVTDGTSKTVLLQERTGSTRTETVPARRASAPAPRSTIEEKDGNKANKRKVRDHRK